MVNAEEIVGIVVKAVALAAGVSSIVLGYFTEVLDASVQVTLLSIGLAALAIAALQKD